MNRRGMHRTTRRDTRVVTGLSLVFRTQHSAHNITCQHQKRARAKLSHHLLLSFLLVFQKNKTSSSSPSSSSSSSPFSSSSSSSSSSSYSSPPPPPPPTVAFALPTPFLLLFLLLFQKDGHLLHCQHEAGTHRRWSWCAGDWVAGGWEVGSSSC
jgi:hypothetical protein